MSEWLFSGKGHGHQDDKDKILEIIGKKPEKKIESEQKEISVALGEWQGAASDQSQDVEKELAYVEIECSPHLKLIRKDSNLRIYFYWKDDRIGNGKKVLIGRIGRHPY